MDDERFSQASTNISHQTLSLQTIEMIKCHVEQSTLTSIDNPHNWPPHRKWLITILLGASSFTAMLTSTMVAPLLPQITTDLHIPNQAQSQLTLSIYVLAYAFGPLIFAPLSECYGRRQVLLIASLWFLAWNLVGGGANTKWLLFTARLCSGIGASSAFAISTGVLGDCWTVRQRGRSLSIYTFLPLMGPALGPIVGGIVADHTTWHWAFWSTSALSALLQTLAFFFLKETNLPTIQARHMKQLRKAFAIDVPSSEQHNTTSAILKLQNSLTRPFYLLATQHVLQLLALLNAMLFGSLYVILSTLTKFFTIDHSQSLFIISLHYLSLGLGFLVGSQAFGPLSDVLYRRSKNKSCENRLIPLFPSTLLLGTGLVILGWVVQLRQHWAIADLGLLLIGIGSQMGTQCINAYVIDVYSSNGLVASAMAGVWMAKSVAGFTLPLFAPTMYQRIGFGWSLTCLALVCLAFSVPVCLILWFMGEKWRQGES